VIRAFTSSSGLAYLPPYLLATTTTGFIPVKIVRRTLADGDIDGYTLEQAMKICLAALAGKVSGAGTTSITIRSADDTADRIVATVDSNGNRSAVTLDGAG
jgi:hypothetical protein